MSNMLEDPMENIQLPTQEDDKNKNPENTLPAPKENTTVIVNEKSTEERPFWGEFKGAKINGAGEYAEPTIEQKEKFEKRIERVSEIFKDAGFQWYLDGATNISLYLDKQIRDHKDLDISIFKEDLAKLDELLARQGFGIFVNYDENGKRLMQKVDVEELKELEKPDLSICKISPDKKIRVETEDPFNFVDLHIHSKDAEGNAVVSYNGATLPKKFFEPVKKELSNGGKINLSQPVIVAYHKLHSNRPYDLTDLQRLKPQLTETDFDILRDSLVKEGEEMEEKFREAWNSLASVLELKCDRAVISEKLWEQPLLSRRRNDQKISDFVVSISQYISDNPNIKFEDFLSRSFSILKIKGQLEQRLGFIEKLRKG